MTGQDAYLDKEIQRQQVILDARLARIEELEQKLQEREAYWLEWNGRASVRNEGLEDTLEKANRLATQRGARMQIMRAWMNFSWSSNMPTPWGMFVRKYPESADWFDADGVPVREE